MNNNDIEYCECKNSSAVYSQNDDFMWWDRCCDCNKVIEDSITYFNQSDEDY